MTSPFPSPHAVSALLAHCRRLFLRVLQVQASIVIHGFDREEPQRMRIDIDLYVPLHTSTPQRDAIEEVVDYDFVRQVVHRAVGQGHIGLQETLGDAILDALLAHPGVVAARVATSKPDVYPDCEAVGVETFRLRPDAAALLTEAQP